jgi:hypothetical protein
MSSWGRCQDALDDLYESEDSTGKVTDGPAKLAGITYAQWQAVQEAIIEAVFPIAYDQGAHSEARKPKDLS